MYAFQKTSQQLLQNALSHGRRRFHSSRLTFTKAGSAAASFTQDEYWKSDLFQKHAPTQTTYKQGIYKTPSSREMKISFQKPKAISFMEESEDKHLRVDLGGDTLTYHVAWLRDACPCHSCIDKSTTQKTFQTTDIPEDIGIRQLEHTPDGGIRITWKNDLPQYDAIREHVSTFSYKYFENHAASKPRDYNTYEAYGSLPWTPKTLLLHRIPYENFMEADSDLYLALRLLVADGMVMIKGAPSTEDSVELIAKRIGNLRDSLYGRTWDVKSIPEAKNVAYTSTFLGLHMDLLYMKDPPGLQLLHCLKNTCEGGAAIFSDSFNAAKCLSNAHTKALATSKTAYHYRNNNEHYYHEHSTLEFKHLDSTKPILKYVNWSPPFQANYPYLPGDEQTKYLPELLEASRAFAKLVEAPDNIFEYEYEEGDCVIFNNRRILHGRKAFQAEGGERWLRGAYVDTDVFHSRIRVLREQFEGLDNGFIDLFSLKARYVK